MKTKAERMKAHRARKRQGVTCIARVPVYEADVAALVERGMLRPEDAAHTARISEAIEGLVDSFTEANSAGGARHVIPIPVDGFEGFVILYVPTSRYRGLAWVFR